MAARAMTKEGVFSRLLQELDKVFTPQGFTFRKSSEDFARTVGEVRQSIGVPFCDYNPIFRFSLIFRFRVEAVQSLYHPFSGIEPEYQPESSTCTVNLEAITPEAGKWIEVRDGPTIAAAVTRLKPGLEREVFPFLDRHQDVVSLDRMMNGDGRDRYDRMMIDHRRMKSIILARLANNPELEQLIPLYRSEISRGCGEEATSAFDPLVEHLKRLA